MLRVCGQWIYEKIKEQLQHSFLQSIHKIKVKLKPYDGGPRIKKGN